jgi:hypothetical protein
MTLTRSARGTALSRAHGVVNIISGGWPLVSERSFEAVFGPKTDRWLQRTVAGLLVGAGWAQSRAATADDWPHARRIGVVTAATLLAVDLAYAPKGRISRAYLLDAAVEATWLLAWASTLRVATSPEKDRSQ